VSKNRTNIVHTQSHSQSVAWTETIRETGALHYNTKHNQQLISSAEELHGKVHHKYNEFIV